MKYLIAVLVIACFGTQGFGQGVNFFGDFGQDTKGRQVVDLYVQGEKDGLQFLGNFFLAENEPQRGSFALGKKIFLGKRMMVNPNIGVTSDKGIYLPTLVFVRLFDRNLVYIPDLKIFPGEKSNTLYQKFAIDVTKGGGLQARLDTFFVSKQLLYVRWSAGPRFTLNGGYIEFLPFYEHTSGNFGFFTAFRW